jgi:hypothetical protein
MRGVCRLIISNRVKDKVKMANYNQRSKNPLKGKPRPVSQSLITKALVSSCSMNISNVSQVNEVLKKVPETKLLKESNEMICPECSRECKGAVGLRSHMRSHKKY